MSGQDPSGDPGRPGGPTRAGLGPRFVAGLIDLGPTAVLIGVGVSVSSILLTFGLLVIAIGWLVLGWGLIGTRMASPGLRVAGLRVTDRRRAVPVGFGRSAGRGIVLVLLVASVVGLVVLAVMLSAARRRGPHDLAAETVVLVDRPSARSGTSAVAPARQEGVDQARASANRESAPDPFAVSDAAVPHWTEAESESTGRVDPDADVDIAPSDRVDVPGSAAGPASDPSGENSDDGALAKGPAEQSPTEQPTEPFPAPTGPTPPDQGWRGLLDEGQEFRLGHLVLLGRRPEPREGEEDAELIRVSDPARTVSKTHVALDVDARGPFVTDRGSTNGTAVTEPDGRYSLLVEGDTHRLGVGDVVSFGDHRVEIIRVESGEVTDPGSLRRSDQPAE